MINIPLMVKSKACHEIRESIEVRTKKSIIDVFPVRFRCCNGFEIQVFEGADIEIDK